MFFLFLPAKRVIFFWGGHGKKTTSWVGKKQQGLCVFFGGEGETIKYFGKEMVSWLLLMKNLRSMEIEEDQRKIKGTVFLWLDFKRRI